MADTEENTLSKIIEDENGQEAQNEGDRNAIRERWERGQRELMTYAFDFNAHTLTSLVRDGQLDISPGYQRRPRWDIYRQSRLIESFLLNIPVPAIYLNEDEAGMYSVIDGMHRIAAIVDFFGDRYALSGLEVFYEANGKKFSDLDPGMQRTLAARATMRATVISHLSDPVMKYDLFQRLNMGGVPLNAQEVRNSTFSGPYNDLLVELSESDDFRTALNFTTNSYSAVWRAMKDVELVLRYFTLRDSWTSFRGSMTYALNAHMSKNAYASLGELQELREDFLSTLKKAAAAFGPHLFRRITNSGRPSPRISVPIYDAQMLSVRGFSIAQLERNTEAIQQGMKELLQNAYFNESTRIHTSSPHSIHYRIESLIGMLHNAVE
ncbi:DUF262 domain-containing protein [Streptomyces caniscabiei]|uniref:DUF262 domain-containing protein n=1 Tax=Streptomyces caniscabiei TaxID=2746961 RepID=A0ABU4N747_9ACTN|nr:DUF262 domain-containing protein [Streptomyces caniscabiei]MBE4739810.1 DUF262 domain-containing protein [Streptomyces caniscabiei]MBE4758700.1 DUF262 domain-containing protein [Streptomyces caniscabiei]MBE4797551.1 DUF262 domain-containing protein [Streptomyces caniscabiei]MDX2944848.1 DUF262 domain-containing protein [Streptomyces caniscabiei]MDX2988421.1 DUF262 domain-containing protein [Streptomyces caniscabiei]